MSPTVQKDNELYQKPFDFLFFNTTILSTLYTFIDFLQILPRTFQQALFRRLNVLIWEKIGNVHIACLILYNSNLAPFAHTFVIVFFIEWLSKNKTLPYHQFFYLGPLYFSQSVI